MYDERESDWSLSCVKESAVPKAHKARAAFDRAMDAWDDEAADAAVAGLVRSAGATTVFERFAYYGMRDFRNIGHKSIYMANSWRTLQCIGWRHAEPVMRSLAYALLNHHEEPNPSASDLEADKPWRRSLEKVSEIRDNWLGGKVSSAATTDLLATMRTGSWSDANQKVLDLLNSGVAPRSIQDALHLGASELLVRQPGIYSLHAVTATNALTYAFRNAGDDRTRRLLLLQNAAFLPQFSDFLGGLRKLRSRRIDTLEPHKMEVSGQAALDEIFRQVSAKPSDAAGKALSYIRSDPHRAREFIDRARRLVFLKTRNSHDYKFSSAVMEDYHQISPTWRDRYLASSVYYLLGTGHRDNKLVMRTRAALKA